MNEVTDSSTSSSYSGSDDSDSESRSSSGSISESHSSFLGDNQVDQLLESYCQTTSGLPTRIKSDPDEESSANAPLHIEKTKTVLKKRGQDHFEILPEGWIEVTHNSGIPLYLHKQSRVCTVSKPYNLGKDSVRKHEVPLSAIPCLAYRREKEKEQEQQENNVNLATCEEYKRERWLSPKDVREYCESLFDFVDITIRKFKTWSDRRKYNSINREKRQRPSLPNDTKLITCSSTDNSTSKKDFQMNPSGKSSVCILHEFVQHQLKVQPRYIYKELENSVTPYSAIAEINSVTYGEGFGKSKRDAKEEAARKTIEVLIPKMKDTLTDSNGNKANNSESSDLRFFDDIKIEDSRITELCQKAGLQSPYQILVECLKRNAGYCNTEIEQNVQLIRHHKNIYTMKVGEHEAKVDCKNKREGKQKAAQVILQKLHPQVTSWGGLLLMYGRGSCKTPKEKKEEEQKITELQSTASPNEPNRAILNKLREEMRKLNY